MKVSLIALAWLLVIATGCRTSAIKGPNDQVSAIERVLSADVAAYKQTVGMAGNKNSASTTAVLVGRYASALREISFAGVPNEFHYAYMEHIHAWEGMHILLQRQPEKGDLSMLLGLAGLASGQAHVGLPALLGSVSASDRNSRQLNTEKRAASDEIRLTWNKIELLAVGSGAKLPKAPVE